MENKTIGLVTFAILIEGIITYCNEFYVQGTLCWKMIFSLILGIVVAVAYKIDLLLYFNLKSDIPYIGCVITGILISRGSNYIFDLIGKLSLS